LRLLNGHFWLVGRGRFERQRAPAWLEVRNRWHRPAAPIAYSESRCPWQRLNAPPINALRNKACFFGTQREICAGRVPMNWFESWQAGFTQLSNYQKPRNQLSSVCQKCETGRWCLCSIQLLETGFALPKSGIPSSRMVWKTWGCIKNGYLAAQTTIEMTKQNQSCLPDAYMRQLIYCLPIVPYHYFRHV
jgi:hypothetical protein